MKLKNIDVYFISIVTAGANGKDIVLKSSDGADMRQIPIKKTIAQKGVRNEVSGMYEGMIYGIVYAPDEIDSDGDTATAEEIKAASYRFMEAQRGRQIDINHDLRVVKACVVESWIVGEGDRFFTEKGAWAVGIKVDDWDVLYKIENGELGGLSMWAVVEVEDDVQKSKGDKSLVEQILDGMKKLLGKEDKTTAAKAEDKKEDTDMTPDEVKALVKSEVETAVKSAVKSALDEQAKIAKPEGAATDEIVNKNKDDIAAVKGDIATLTEAMSKLNDKLDSVVVGKSTADPAPAATDEKKDKGLNLGLLNGIK